MRALLAFAVVMSVLGIHATRASAETELAVFPPVGGNKADSAAVKGGLAKAGVGTLATKTIDSECAADPGCLTKTGSQIGARRVVAITVNGGGKLTLMLVDVVGRI